METKDTCLYIHTRKDNGRIFYVGIGTIKRPYSIDNRNRFWKSVVKKYGRDVTILKTDMSWEDACQLEIMMIAFCIEKASFCEEWKSLTCGTYNKRWIS
jgi:hypothetical protein